MKKRYERPQTQLTHVGICHLMAGTIVSEAVTEESNNSVLMSTDGVVSGGDASAAAARGGTFWDED